MAVENSTVLIIVNNWGIEETELTRPLRDLKAAGAKVTLAATTLDPCETVQHDRYEGETLTPDARLSDVQAADYDLLVVPGGTCNVDRIRVMEVVDNASDENNENTRRKATVVPIKIEYV